MNVRVGAKISKQGARITVWVNEVRVYEDERPEPFSSGEFWTAWLKPGANTVRWECEALEEAEGDARVELEVARQSFDPPGLDVLGRVTASDALPASGAASFEMPDDFPALAFWREGDDIELDGATRDGLINFVCVPFEALAADDPAAAVEALAPALVEALGPMGLSPDDPMVRDELSALAEAFASFPAPEPPDDDELLLELMGGGRLVRVERRDGSPLLELGGDDLSIAVPSLYYARIDGQWTVAG